MRGKSNFGRVVVFGVVFVYMFNSAVFGQPWDGNGTAEDPYQIWTAEDMQAIGTDSNYWDAQFQLMADIDLNDFTGSQFNIIGYFRTDWNNHPFTGGFDGGSHTISNFTHTGTSVNYLGLFGHVGSGAEIFDVGLVNCNIAQGSNGTGSLIGLLNGGTVSNCWSRDGIVNGSFRSGGLIGQVYAGTVYSCFSEGGWVSAEHNYSGGLVGENKGDISNCYAICGVGDSEGIVGGFLGYNNSGNVMYCYSTGPVTGDWGLGGLVGDNEGSVTSSFWDIETSGVTFSNGGTGKTTAEMQTKSTFMSAGWDFTTPVWTICGGLDYPRLLWQSVDCLKYGGGSGTAEDPYLIYTAAEMQEIGEKPGDWDAHFRLMADIDLADYNGLNGNPAFNIIGNDVNSFAGVFDGCGHTIGNFVYESNGVDYIGLFGYVDGASAEIKDLGLIEPDINAATNRYTGSLVGSLQAGDVFDCYMENGRVSGDVDVGGLIGYNYKNDIYDCYSTGIVNGRDIIGGLIGTNGNGTMTDCYSGCDVSGSRYVGGLGGTNGGELIRCYAAGGVIGTGPYSGGLVGLNINGTVNNSHSSGNVTGDSMVGGLLGQNHNGVVLHCYSTSIVVGNTWRGGLIGYDNTGTYSSSFWNSEVNPTLNGIGNGTNPEVIGESTANMWTESTFTDAGWDFATPVWTICEGEDYPRLWWEEVVCSDYGGGSGTAEDPYLIYTAAHMNAIGERPYDWVAHFRLMADIDLSAYTGTSFNMIGTSSVGFHGVFDGNRRSILNFTYSITGSDYVGLFRSLEGEIKDLGLVSPHVSAGTGDFVGALVGDIDDGTISNCYVEGGSVSGNTFVGGLVGGIHSGSISMCYSTSNVNGEAAVGGLVGSTLRGLITNCYVTGSVSGASNVGGLAGNNEIGAIYRCYSVGSVSGNSNVGGLLGIELQNALTLYCFWDIEASGQATSAGGTGKATPEMMTESTFSGAGWDFTTPVWTIDEGLDYPRLWWESGIILTSIDMDEMWMYQNLAGQSNSDLTASVSITDDPWGNSSYSYAWEILLPGDVNLAPVTVYGGGAGDAYWTFAARGCDEPGGLSDSGQTFTVRVTVTGDDYGNTGQAEAEFGIALLGDVNNDGVVNVADRAIANAFWVAGSAGPYTLRDCDVNCDGVVNVADRAIANAIWVGGLGQKTVSSPCPLR